MSSAPVFPYPGGVAGDEPPDPTAGAPGHFAWSRWIKQFVKNLDSQKVAKTGDTMTGPLRVPLGPTDPDHVTPKDYVDRAILGLPAPYVPPVVAFGGMRGHVASGPGTFPNNVVVWKTTTNEEGPCDMAPGGGQIVVDPGLWLFQWQTYGQGGKGTLGRYNGTGWDGVIFCDVGQGGFIIRATQRETFVLCNDGGTLQDNNDNSWFHVFRLAP